MRIYDKEMRAVCSLPTIIVARLRAARPRLWRRPGQAVVEMLIVLPVLLLLVLGLVVVGQLLLANYTINQAARAAHQAALAGGEADAAYTAAENVISGGVGTNPANADISVDCARTPCRRWPGSAGRWSRCCPPRSPPPPWRPRPPGSPGPIASARPRSRGRRRATARAPP